MRKKPRGRVLANATWERCRLDFLAAMAAKSSGNTAYQYDLVLRRFLSDPYKSPEKYTRANVEHFIQLPAARGRQVAHPPAANTQKKRLIALSSFYKYAQRYSVPFRKTTRFILKTGGNPTIGIETPGAIPQDADLDEEQMARFFAQIPRNSLIGLRDRALFLAYFWTGRRCSEIVNLLWGDLEQVALMEDGRQQAAWFYRWKGKRHYSKDSSAEMPKPAMCAIREYLEVSGRWGDLEPGDPIFIDENHVAARLRGCQINGDAVRYRFRLYARDAGLPKACVVHSIRHLAAWLHYQENGRDIEEVARWLGHTGLGTILVYIRRRESKRKLDLVSRRMEAKYAY
jgi:site-specific recombinase XerD